MRILQILFLLVGCTSATPEILSVSGTSNNLYDGLYEIQPGTFNNKPFYKLQFGEAFIYWNTGWYLGTSTSGASDEKDSCRNSEPSLLACSWQYGTQIRGVTCLRARDFTLTALNGDYIWSDSQKEYIRIYGSRRSFKASNYPTKLYSGSSQYSYCGNDYQSLLGCTWWRGNQGPFSTFTICSSPPAGSSMCYEMNDMEGYQSSYLNGNYMFDYTDSNGFAVYYKLGLWPPPLLYYNIVDKRWQIGPVEWMSERRCHAYCNIDTARPDMCDGKWMVVTPYEENMGKVSAGQCSAGLEAGNDEEKDVETGNKVEIWVWIVVGAVVMVCLCGMVVMLKVYCKNKKGKASFEEQEDIEERADELEDSVNETEMVTAA